MDIGNIFVALGRDHFCGHAATVRIDTAGARHSLGATVPDRIGGNGQSLTGHCDIRENCCGSCVDDQIAAVVDDVAEVTGFNRAGIRLSLGATNRYRESFTGNTGGNLRSEGKTGRSDVAAVDDVVNPVATETVGDRLVTRIDAYIVKIDKTADRRRFLILSTATVDPDRTCRGLVAAIHQTGIRDHPSITGNRNVECG